MEYGAYDTRAAITHTGPSHPGVMCSYPRTFPRATDMPGLTACLFYGDRTSEATTIPPLRGGTPNVHRLILRGGTPNVTHNFF